MTSPSPTRRRTTRLRSIPERRRRGARVARAAVIAALLLLAAAPAGAAWRDFERAASSPPPAPVAAADDRGCRACAETPQGAAVVVPPGDEVPAAVLPVAAEEAAGACAEEAEACREALDRLRADTLADVNIDIRVGGRPGSDYPCECRLEGETFQPRRFATTTFTWKAAGYGHKPLYFEHWNLERYGHSHGFVADSFLSAAHFFARIPALPYQMGVELPWECVYPLGYYRPGSCAPWTVPAVPVSLRGFAVGAATATGIVFVLP